MRGYVVFNVEYRDGTITTTDMAPGTMRPFTTVQQQLATYRACQDARGAIRTIIQRAIDGFDSDKYRIDYKNIFVGGASGGALAAMSAAWYTAPMVYAVFPAASGSPNIQQALGNINTNYYDALATMDYQQYIRGTVSISGAIGIPLSYNSHEYDFFDQFLLKPHIGFHGKLDDVFPYPDGSNQKVYFAPPPPINSTDYNKETLCIGTISYNLDNTDIAGSTADQINGSGLNMRNILNHFSIANELYLDCDLYHDPYHNGVFTGNYGTTAGNQTQAAKYIAQRIATFFQAVLSGRAGSIGTDYFPNCENFRYGCNTQTTACSGCQ